MGYVVSHIFQTTGLGPAGPSSKGRSEMVWAARRELQTSGLAGEKLTLRRGKPQRGCRNPLGRRVLVSYPWLHHSHASQAAIPKRDPTYGSAAAWLRVFGSRDTLPSGLPGPYNSFTLPSSPGRVWGCSAEQ